MAEDGKKPDTAPEVEEVKKSAPAAETPASADTPVKEDTYEIRINSYKIVSAAGVVAVHNEVAFYRNGEPMIAMNGNAHNNQTGELNTFAITPGNTLRVSAGNQTYGQGLNPMELVGSVTVGSNLSREEFLEKLKAATAAAQYINSNKIDYVVIGGPNYEAQNSNSVASALLQAMGYKYPQNEFSQLWAPGSKRNLLPDDWKSNLSNDQLIQALEALDRNKVNQQVIDDKIPRLRLEEGQGYFPNLHDPNKATATKAMAQFAKLENAVIRGFTQPVSEQSRVEATTNFAASVKASTFLSSTDSSIKFGQDLSKVFSSAADSDLSQVRASKALEGEYIRQHLIQNAQTSAPATLEASAERKIKSPQSEMAL